MSSDDYTLKEALARLTSTEEELDVATEQLAQAGRMGMTLYTTLTDLSDQNNALQQELHTATHRLEQATKKNQTLETYLEEEEEAIISINTQDQTITTENIQLKEQLHALQHTNDVMVEDVKDLEQEGSQLLLERQELSRVQSQNTAHQATIKRLTTELAVAKIATDTSLRQLQEFQQQWDTSQPKTVPPQFNRTTFKCAAKREQVLNELKSAVRHHRVGGRNRDGNKDTRGEEKNGIDTKQQTASAASPASPSSDTKVKRHRKRTSTLFEKRSAQWFVGAEARILQCSQTTLLAELDNQDPATAQKRLAAYCVGLHGKNIGAQMMSDIETIHKDVNRFTMRTVDDAKFLEFLQRGGQDEDENEDLFASLRTDMTTLLTCCVLQHPQPGYAQGFHTMAALVLSVEPRIDFAFSLFTCLTQWIMPQDYWVRPPAAMNGLQIELEVLLDVSLHCIPSLSTACIEEYHALYSSSPGSCCSSTWIHDYLSPIIHMLGIQCLVPLFVDFVNIDVTLVIWDRLFDRREHAQHRSLRSTNVPLYAMLALLSAALEEPSAEEPSVAASADGGTTAATAAATSLKDVLKEGVRNCTVSSFTKHYGRISNMISATLLHTMRTKTKLKLGKAWSNPVAVKKLTFDSGVLFSRHDLEHLQTQFRKLSSVSATTKEGEITYQQFETIINNLWLEKRVLLPGSPKRRRKKSKEENPATSKEENDGRSTSSTSSSGQSSTSSQKFVKLLFDFADRSNTGRIDFRELICLLSTICRGTMEERLAITFNAYDTKSTGYLVEQDVRALVDAILCVKNEGVANEGVANEGVAVGRRTSIMARETEQLIGLLDVDGDGRITLEDFKAFMSRDIDLMHCFGFGEKNADEESENVVEDVVGGQVAFASRQSKLRTFTSSTIETSMLKMTSQESVGRTAEALVEVDEEDGGVDEEVAALRAWQGERTGGEEGEKEGEEEKCRVCVVC